MRLSPAGLALLRQFEGFRPTPYLDTAGLSTIGYGHRVRPGESFPGAITEARAEELLAADVAVAERAVARLVTASLTQSQFDALVDFAYNLGEGRLAGSTLLKDLNAGRVEAAAAQLLQWDHAAGREVPGLRKRRQAEYGLFAAQPAPHSQPNETGKLKTGCEAV